MSNGAYTFGTVRAAEGPAPSVEAPSPEEVLARDAGQEAPALYSRKRGRKVSPPPAGTAGPAPAPPEPQEAPEAPRGPQEPPAAPGLAPEAPEAPPEPQESDWTAEECAFLASLGFKMYGKAMRPRPEAWTLQADTAEGIGTRMAAVAKKHNWQSRWKEEVQLGIAVAVGYLECTATEAIMLQRTQRPQAPAGGPPQTPAGVAPPPGGQAPPATAPAAPSPEDFDVMAAIRALKAA